MVNGMFFLIPLLASIWFLNFGLRLLFQKGYVEEQFGMNEEKGEFVSLTKGQVYFYNKYVRGVGCLSVGLMMLIIGILGLYREWFS